MTITGWFTIGIPAFLLSLAPNNERARPGFASRVLTQAVPSAPEGTIYGELVTTLHPDNDPDFHANVTLVE